MFENEACYLVMYRGHRWKRYLHVFAHVCLFCWWSANYLQIQSLAGAAVGTVFRSQSVSAILPALRVYQLHHAMTVLCIYNSNYFSITMMKWWMIEKYICGMSCWNGWQQGTGLQAFSLLAVTTVNGISLYHGDQSHSEMYGFGLAIATI